MRIIIVARACECVWVYVSPGFERVFIVYIYVCQIVLKTKKKKKRKQEFISLPFRLADRKSIHDV